MSKQCYPDLTDPHNVTGIFFFRFLYPLAVITSHITEQRVGTPVRNITRRLKRLSSLVRSITSSA